MEAGETERTAWVLLRLVVDGSYDFGLHVAWPLLAVTGVVAGIAVLLRYFGRGLWRGNDFELDESEFGIGNQKVRIKPNVADRQIAYKIWVELSTRKIGLPIDFDDDVIVEVYNSWYSFFAVTRELMKEIPVSKLRSKSTREIIRISVALLNAELRPHLTRWQARFRRWYDQESKKEENQGVSPQDIQKTFSGYRKLTEDMLRVNNALRTYRERMYQLATGTKEIDIAFPED